MSKSFKNKKVVIIILNFNGLKDTIECLESLKKIDYPNYEIIVVDNGSKIDEGVLLKNHFKDYIKVIRSDINLGFGEGNNLALKEVLKDPEVEYVVFLNNDTVVDSSFLTGLVKVAEKDQKIAIVGSRIYDYFSKKIVFDGGKIDKKLKLIPLFLKQSNNLDYHYSEVFSGACFLVKTRYIKEYSLFFDKDLFLYGEEIDLSFRIKKLNLKMAISHKSKIFHKESQSLGKGLSYLKVYYNTRNRILLAKKHLLIKDQIFFYFLFLTSRLIRELNFLLKGEFDLSKGNLRGIIDGILNKTGKLL